ncbi:hypothetical protein F511_40732 [Dorcoceras hygrometricum]|uniref:Uncharacterized protein n=1 Tax=Dorcoceras hygrometricum TaxID=472368 RepID=A0A2Z7AJZ2_9LAMI|nr:hypothetical protein F511_40732 [Dorcoceras hygrometricum]
MRRVANNHSSWARQRQVELLYASGNPGSTAGRGFNPAGGVPGDIAIGSVMAAENRLEDCISEDIYQQTSLLYLGSFLPTDIETVQDMFADTRLRNIFVIGTVRVTFAINSFCNSKFNGTSFAVNRYEHSRNVRSMTSPSDLATMVDKRSDDRYKKEERYKRDEETDERAVKRSKERSKNRRMRTRSDKRPSRKHDRKLLMDEESTKSWADTDSESSSNSSSSSDSEQEEVHCLMADQTSDDEVFDFSNIEFTREDLVQALNDMVHEYKSLSHTFEEIKAENASLKISSVESSSDELEDTDSLKTELSNLRIENELMRSESSELKAEVEKLTKEMSSWTQSARAFHKLQESKTYDKFNKMRFVKANVINDCFESITFDDQNSPKLNDNRKAGIGFSKPENSKPSWIKNKLEKDKAKAGRKPFVPNQPWRSSTKGRKHPVVENNLAQAVGSKQVAEELMSIDDLLMKIPDDMLLPSVSAVEITKIRIGEFISINEVQERDLYYASFPRIYALDKGKEILEEDEPVKGNPTRETVELICGDVEFLVQLRDRVMKDVVEFFHSFSLNKLNNLDGLLELKEKEKLMLEWAETDSLETAVKRKMYILAKYREMLLRKFLDSHRKYFIPGQPWTATKSQIIDLLTVAHSKSLEALVAQQKELGLPIEQPCTSTFLDASGILTESFVGYFRDSYVQNLSDLILRSSDGSTVYRSPSPLRDESVALGPVLERVFAIFLHRVLVFLLLLRRSNSESPPATSPCMETSTSSTSLSMHFDADDIPLVDTADIQTSLPVGRTKFVEAIDDLRAFLLQHIDDSNSEILSKLHTLERGLRDTLHIQDAKAHKLINSVCQDAHSISDVQKIHLNDVAAIRNEQLEFQTKIAADLLSLCTQIGDIVDYIRGGDAKNGEGSSRRRPLPTPVHKSEGTGDVVRLTEPTQADIDNANRAILERE